MKKKKQYRNNEDDTPVRAGELIGAVAVGILGLGIVAGKMVHFKALKAYYKYVKKEKLPPEYADYFFH